MNVIDELREQGKMIWIDEERGWIAAPGVNATMGSVASTIWGHRASEAHAIMFITIDGESVPHRRTLDLERNSSPSAPHRGEAS